MILLLVLSIGIAAGAAIWQIHHHVHQLETELFDLAKRLDDFEAFIEGWIGVGPDNE